MAQRINEFGQPIGQDVEGWVSCPRPPQVPLLGQYAHVVPLDAQAHVDDLYNAVSADTGKMWTYLFNGPYTQKSDFAAYLAASQESTDPLFYTILDATNGQAMGYASYLRIDLAMGVIEVGNIAMSPLLQKTRIATEAIYLMMAHAFDDLGYRRFEWKCDNLNGPSKKAARRFGFAHDGIFPQAVIYKGRNRDTAWFSITDADWPHIQEGFEAWLDPANFDGDGMQKTALVTRRI